MTRIILVVALAAALSGCATMAAEYTSPCACDWRPVGEAPNAEVLA